MQEFQVLTQNFKAEYEKAGSAIITAVTKSGGNRYAGDIFNFYQDRAGNVIVGSVYRGDISWDFPAEAVYGSGDPDLSATNYQLGVFAQDDWRVGRRLTLNLGLRWDYESDMLNNDHVTPENARLAAAPPFVDAARYFTDGDDRPPSTAPWLRPAEQPDRSRPAPAGRPEVWVLTSVNSQRPTPELHSRTR